MTLCVWYVLLYLRPNEPVLTPRTERCLESGDNLGLGLFKGLIFKLRC